MDLESRQPFNALAPQHFCLCKNLEIVGVKYRFGDELAWHTPLFHKSFHHSHGVVGIKSELDSLSGSPVELSTDDLVTPVARFVSHPLEYIEIKEEIEEAGGEEFSMENAKLAKTKDLIIKYAALFDIKLKKASNVPMKEMFATLEKKAVSKGLITGE